MTKDESPARSALKLALEALEETRNALAWFYDSYPQDVTQRGDKLLPHVETVLTAIREALADHFPDATKIVEPAQQEPVAITEQMAFAFHNATTDGALGKDDTMDIMRGLKAAFAHIAAPQPAQQPDMNLNCKSVQARLATSWGYVKAEQPAQRTWEGLTQDEFRDFASTLEYGTGGLIRAIEAKLKEKNT